MGCSSWRESERVVRRRRRRWGINSNGNGIAKSTVALQKTKLYVSSLFWPEAKNSIEQWTIAKMAKHWRGRAEKLTQVNQLINLRILTIHVPYHRYPDS